MIGETAPVEEQGDQPCPECATPVAARHALPLERGSCTGCGLQLVRRPGGDWREIRG